MRVTTWNIYRAKEKSPVWELLEELHPDLVFLQEVGSIPERIKRVFDVLSKVAISKKGRPQRFSTAVLVKGKIVKEIPLSSDKEWVNQELEFLKGNFISSIVQPLNQETLSVVSVYSPAWAVNQNRLKGIDVSSLRLKSNSKVWATEIIWDALKNTVSNDEKWIVGGDYNSSETFDKEWQDKNRVKFALRSSGNKEVLDRMYEMGFTECLRKYNSDKIVPTFKNRSNNEIVHQMDHLFVTNNLYARLNRCTTGDQSTIFSKALSDHLPIIADFNEEI